MHNPEMSSRQSHVLIIFLDMIFCEFKMNDYFFLNTMAAEKVQRVFRFW